jgi:hypothetical protein
LAALAPACDRGRWLTYKAREIQAGIDKLRVHFRTGQERNAWFKIDDKPVLLITAPKIHRGDVPVGTADAIRKQLLLSRDLFDDLVKCPLTGPDYEGLIREKQRTGTLPPPRGQ